MSDRQTGAVDRGQAAADPFGFVLVVVLGIAAASLLVQPDNGMQFAIAVVLSIGLGFAGLLALEAVVR